MTRLSLLGSQSPSLVSFLGDGELDTLTLGQGDPRLRTFTDDENVGKTSGKSSVQDVSDVNNVETTVVPLPRDDHTGSTHVSTTGDHDDVSRLELDVVDNLVVNQVKLDGVVGLDNGVRVSDRSTVVGDEVRHTLLTELVRLDFEELVSSFFRGDSVDGESTLDVVQQSEVFTGSLDGDNVHETGRVGFIGPDLSINLDDPLRHDSGDFSAGQGVLQSVSEEDGHGQAFSELVGTGGRSRGVGTRQLVQHP